MTTTTDPNIRLSEYAVPDEEKLLKAFFGMYKTARMLEPNNQTYKKQLDFLCMLMQKVAPNEADITFKAVSERFFVNSSLVPFNEEEAAGASRVISEWRVLGLGGVTFVAGINEDEISRFFSFMAEIKPSLENLESLSEQLDARDLSHIELLSIKEVLPEKPEMVEEDRQRFRVMARKTFFQAMAVVQEAVANTVQDRDINIAKTKRVVHSLIDHITRDESSLIELSAIKDFDDYTYAHSTNVCVYALTVGVRMGLDRPRLSRLGFASLFHDIGKVKLPADLIRKPDAFDENDWLQMIQHPTLGAKTILRNQKLSEHSARAARSAFEHHINDDFTGYPVLHYNKRQKDLFSRIISIVDNYDALTSGRVYIKKSIPPDMVLRKMRYQMHVKFDHFLLKIFTNIIGVYPAGSLVLLNTDELALVLTHNDQDKARPIVKIIGNRSGFLKVHEWVDLSRPDQLHRSIIRLVEPERYGIDMKDFILQD